MKELAELNAIYQKMSTADVDEAMIVTNADKKGNTPAYQGYKAGKKKKDGTPMYKAADHMKEGKVNAGLQAYLDKKKGKKSNGDDKKEMNGNGNGNGTPPPTAKEIEQIVAKASAGGPVQTIRIEQAPLKITTDDKPYQL